MQGMSAGVIIIFLKKKLYLSSETKYPEVILDTKLDGNQHLEHVINKAIQPLFAERGFWVRPRVEVSYFHSKGSPASALRVP